MSYVKAIYSKPRIQRSPGKRLQSASSKLIHVRSCIEGLRNSQFPCLQNASYEFWYVASKAEANNDALDPLSEDHAGAKIQQIETPIVQQQLRHEKA